MKNSFEDTLFWSFRKTKFELHTRPGYAKIVTSIPFRNPRELSLIFAIPMRYAFGIEMASALLMGEKSECGIIVPMW